jgi:hypothetical protein
MKKIIFNIVVLCFLIGGKGVVFGQHPQVDDHDPLDTFDISIAGDIDQDGYDTATVNAVMPYRVSPDNYFVNRPAIYNPSGFEWLWSGTIPLENTSGGIPTAIETGIYEDTIVYATMGNAATPFNDTLLVSEKSYPKNGTGCKDPTPDTVFVTVVDKPTMTLTSNDTIGECGSLSAQDTFKFTFTGTYPFYVAYTIKAWDDAAVQQGITVQDTAYVEAGDEGLIFNQTQLDDANPAAPPGNYTVEIDGLWDRYSWRALNRSNASVMSDYDVNAGADNDLAIFIYPVPNTNAIRELKTVKP